MNSRVQCPGKVSPQFETVVRLRQYDATPKFLFNVCKEKGIKNVKTNPGATVFHSTRQCLTYAYNFVVQRQAVRHIAQAAEYVKTVASHTGSTITASTPKHMINSRKNGNIPEKHN